MYRIINHLLLFILFYLPLINGGKGFRAFCVTSCLLFVMSLMIINLRNQNLELKLPPLKKFYLLMTGFLLLAGINIFTSVCFFLSFIEWIRILSYGLFFCLILISTSIDQEKFDKFLKTTLVIFISLATVQSLVMISQYFRGLALYGTMPNENLAAGYVLIGFTIIFSYLVFQSKISKSSITVCLLISAVMLSAIWLSHSRGVMLALLVELAIFAKLKYKKWGLILFILIGLIFLAVIPIEKVDDFLKIKAIYSYRRIYIWQSAWQMAMARSWLGWGLGNFGLIYPRFNLPSFETIAAFGKVTRFAHNEFLQIAAEMGLPALLIFGAMVFWIGKKGFGINLVKSKDWKLVSAFCGFCGIVVHSLVDFNLHLPAITTAGIFFAAIIFVASGSEKYLKIPEWGKKIEVLVNVIFLTLIFSITCFFTAHNYSLRGEKNKDIDSYKKAILFNPWESYYHEKLAKLYEEQSVKMATEEYRRAIELNPDESKFYSELFYLSYKSGLPLNYLNHLYNIEQQKNPYDVKLILNLGAIYANRNDFQTASKLFAEAIGKEPNFLQAYYYLGLCLEKMGQQKKAQIIYEKILSISSRNLERFVQSDYEKELIRINLVDVCKQLRSLKKSP